MEKITHPHPINKVELNTKKKKTVEMFVAIIIMLQIKHTKIFS